MAPNEKNVRSLVSHFFSVFFLSNPLPRIMDAKHKLQMELDKVEDAEALINYLIPIFTHLHLMGHNLERLCLYSVKGSFLNFKFIPKESSDKQLQIFSTLCEDFKNGNFKHYDQRYLQELCMQLVMFNHMKRPAIIVAMSFFEKLSDWLKEQQFLFQISTNSKACSCYTYKMCGDCGCEEDDYGGFDDYDIHDDCDALLYGSGAMAPVISSTRGHDVTD